MQITRTKTTTYKVLQVGVDFLEFTERYKEIRQNRKYHGFQCFICHKKFGIGEKMSLLFTNKGNKMACRDCGMKAREELGEA